jgi:hypothetical protein
LTPTFAAALVVRSTSATNLPAGFIASISAGVLNSIMETVFHAVSEPAAAAQQGGDNLVP